MPSQLPSTRSILNLLGLVLVSSVILHLSSHPVFADTCTLTVPTSQPIIDGNQSPYNTIQPGHTICITSGNRPPLQLKNLHGTSSSPITVINSGGKVVIDAQNADHGIRFESVDHLRITGTGQSGTTYGFEIKNGAIAVRGYEYVHHLELDHLDIGPTAKDRMGILMNTSPQLNNTMTNLYLHHNYLHDIGAESFYIGHSGYPSGARVEDLDISYNRIERSGWDGIQVGSGTKNIAVHHNTIIDSGWDDTNTHSGNGGYGIILNPGSIGQYYNNTIVNTNRAGIYASSQTTGYQLFNNLIVNPGNTTATKKEGIYAWSPGKIYNNTIVSSGEYGIEVAITTTGGSIYNNLIVNAGASPIVKNNFSVANNLEIASLSGADFVNSSQQDYHLQSSSPAVNAGTNSGAPAFDLDDRPRPVGSQVDVGAYEFGTSPVLPTPKPCPTDYTQDQVTNLADLLYILSHWGPGFTVTQLLAVLAKWGLAC